MSDSTYFILVLAVAAIVIFGAASWMDKSRKKANAKVQLPLGPVSQILLWISRGILVITILALIGSYIISGFVFQLLHCKET